MAQAKAKTVQAANCLGVPQKVMEDVCIVVPIYRQRLDEFEYRSITQLKRILGGYELILVAPPDVEERWIHKEFGKCTITRMPKIFFKSPYHYSFMLTCSAFYNKFTSFKNILIYQTDAYVFSDQLMKWVNCGYSYVGAPLRLKYWGGEEQQIAVGNGGFSLRNVQDAIDVIEISRKAQKKLFDKFNCYVPGGIGTILFKIKLLLFSRGLYSRSDLRFLRNWSGQEDFFFSFLAPLLSDRFKICPPRQAIDFAFDMDPNYFYEINNKKLPFGCHGWQKNNLEFWREFIIDNRGNDD